MLLTCIDDDDDDEQQTWHDNPNTFQIDIVKRCQFQQINAISDFFSFFSSICRYRFFPSCLYIHVYLTTTSPLPATFKKRFIDHFHSPISSTFSCFLVEIQLPWQCRTMLEFKQERMGWVRGGCNVFFSFQSNRP